MLDIESIEFTNFRSFRGAHKWVLPKDPGLYFLTGRNEANPNLVRNGVGKSSLLEAIQWCLYGKTSRGLHASNVVTWGEESCQVTLEININGQRYCISRSQSPNSLNLDSDVVHQPKIDGTINLRGEAFNNAVIIPQFGDSFLDLTPSAKLTLFSDIIGLDHWLERSQKASLEVDKVTAAQIRCEKSIAAAEGQMKILSDDIDDLLEKEAQFQCTVDEAEASYRGYRKRLSEIKKLRTEISKKLKVVHKDIKTHEKLLKGLDRAEMPLHSSIVELSANTDSIKRNIAEIEDLKGECPLCKEPVDKEHVGHVTAKLRKDLWSLEKSIAQSETERKQVLASLDLAEVEFKRLNRQMLDLNKEDLALDREQREIQVKLEIEEQENPYQGLIKEKGDQYEKIEGLFVTLRQQLEDLTQKGNSTAFWVPAFKRLRLNVVEQTLHTLEVEVNSNLASLGLADWCINFDVERENKSGGVTKGFTVAISSPDSKEIVPWAAWSGGESQLLRLAATLGLSDLIMTRAGMEAKVLFLDEPSAHISDVTTLCDTLAHLAQTKGCKVWLVDHRSVDYGGFAGQVVVVKDEKGSHLT